MFDLSNNEIEESSPFWPITPEEDYDDGDPENKGGSMMAMKMTTTVFEDRRAGGRLQPFVYYQTEEGVAWSPDGEGFFWYDTMTEALAQHG